MTESPRSPWGDWSLVSTAIQRIIERSDHAPVFIHADSETGPFAVVLDLAHYNELLDQAGATEQQAMNHGHEDGDDW